MTPIFTKYKGLAPPPQAFASAALVDTVSVVARCLGPASVGAAMFCALLRANSPGPVSVVPSESGPALLPPDKDMHAIEPTRDRDLGSDAEPATKPTAQSASPCDPTVLLLVTSLGVGGAERHAISLANLLSDRFRTAVAYLKSEEAMIDALDRTSLADLRCLNVQKRVDLSAARALARLITEQSIRVVVCANAFALMYAHFARALCRESPRIVEIYHTTKLRNAKEHLEMLVYRPFFWRADWLVFVCDAQRRYWKRRALWARRTEMIYNGVDLAHFDPVPYAGRVAVVRAKYGFSAQDRIVGLCAALRPEKVHIDLLEAVARLHSEGQPWKVMLIGDGPMRGTIESRISELGLLRAVVITGFQADVRESLAACDVLSLVSFSETFSIATLEAMAMGKPVLMSDVGGAREQVSHGVNGLIFPARDIAALVDCLRVCWDRAAVSEMGLAARERVRRDFSLEAMVDRYVAMLSRALAA